MSQAINYKRIYLFLTILIVILSFWMAESLSTEQCYADNTVTVYLTVSEDGEFVAGNDPDNTVLASTPLEVEYFDLAEYGLERFAYKSEEEIPTMLHAFIRATEKYYLGRKMQPDDFETKAMMVTNNPGSLYLKYFWGHDENFLYHVNDEYPEAAPGWGATCDRIVLEDNDTIDLAMFTSWGISSTGAFAFFADKNISIDTGEPVELTGCSVGGMLSGSEKQKRIMSSEQLKVSRDGGRTWVRGVARTNDDGVAYLRFLEPGTYYVSAGPEFSEYEAAVGADYRCVAPPICIIEVTGEPVEYEPRKVSFESNGGNAVDQQSVKWYCSADKPEDPVRDGYDFTGWYSDAELTNKYDFDLAVKSNITLYAGWKETEAHAEEQCKKILSAKKKAAKAAKTTVTVKALKKHKARVTWKKVNLSYTVDGKKYTAKVTGYKVYRATKKTGKYKQVKIVRRAGTLKYTDKKLKKGKKYYYKVRIYTRIDGKNYLGKWSKAAVVTAK